MSKKQKSTTNQTVTSTPTNPQFVTDTTQGLAGMIQKLSGQDPQSFVADPTSLMNQQQQQAMVLGAQGGGWLGQAGQMAGGVGNVQAAQAQASGASDYMGNYFNPYDTEVINNTMADLDRARQLTQNTNGQGAIAAGQYGGSRQGVLDANANSDFLRNVGNVAGSLRHQGFTTAAGLGAGDADRFTGTSQFNAGQANNVALANQQAKLAGAGLLGQLGTAGIGALSDAAGDQQAQAQAEAQAPLSLLQLLSGANAAQPYDLFHGGTQVSNGTTTQKGSALDTIGKLMQTGANAAALFSDARLKTDIRPAGQDARGRNWYDYRYTWDAPDVTRRGVMAHEILATDPAAVGVHPTGFLMVDYSKLEG